MLIFFSVPTKTTASKVLCEVLSLAGPLPEHCIDALAALMKSKPVQKFYKEIVRIGHYKLMGQINFNI